MAETNFQPSVKTQNLPLAVGDKVCESFDPPCPLPHMVRISNTAPTDLSAHRTSSWTLRVNAAGSLLPSRGAQTQSFIKETPRYISVRVEVQKLESQLPTLVPPFRCGDRCSLHGYAEQPRSRGLAPDLQI